MVSQGEIQIGKKGLTKELLEDIEKRFEKSRNKNIKIRVLQSARESKEDVKKYAEEIQKYLGKQYTNRILGFSIFVKKWRKARE